MTPTASILAASAGLCCVGVLVAQSWEPHTPTHEAVLSLEVRHLKIESQGLSTPMAFRLWASGQVDWSVLQANGSWSPWEAIGD